MQSGDRIVINDRDYRIGSVLSSGTGSYGQVWAATDASGRAVALKLINAEAMAQADPTLRSHWRAHLEREIIFLEDLKALSAAQSRHIVTLLDHGHVDEQPALVLELLQANLGQWLTQQRRENILPDLAQILDWAEQILDGLDVVHEAGFVYRDLKFSNILVGDDGALLKLADFGSLKRENGDNTRSFIGTPATMAPEQVLPARQSADGCEYAVDYRADYYALGLLLFTLLTDRPATAAQRRLGQLLVTHGQEGAGRQREQLGGLNDEERECLRQSIASWLTPTAAKPSQGNAALPLLNLIVGLLARDPNDRPADGSAIRAVFDATRAAQPGALTLTPAWNALLPDETPPNWHPHRSGRRDTPSRRRAALLAGALGLVGAMAWAVIRSGDDIRLDQAVSPHAAVAPATPVVAAPPQSPTIIEPSQSPATTAAHLDQATPIPPAPTEPQSTSEPPQPEPESPVVVAAPPRRPKPSANSDKSRKPPSASSIADDRSTAIVDRPDAPTPSAVVPNRPSSAPATTIPKVAPKIAKLAPKPAAPVTASPIVHRASPVAKVAPAPVVRAKPQPAKPEPVAVRTEPPRPQSTPPDLPPITLESRSRPAASAPPIAAKPSPATARTEPPRPQSTPPDLPPITLESRSRPAASTPPPIAAKPDPVVRAEPPRPQSTPPDLPPIALASRSRSVASAPPPIELVSRSNAASAAPDQPAPGVSTLSTARAEPPHSQRAAPPPATPPAQQQSVDFVRQFQNDAGRAVADVQRQAESFSRWVSRTGTAVGTEVQHGLETADRAVSQWTGRCNQPDGCRRKAQVERRDRWSNRYGSAVSQDDRDDEDASNPPSQQAQTYR